MNASLIGWIVLIVIAYSVVAAMAFIFLFKPRTLVRRQAAFYHRVYKEQSKMSDQEIGRSVKPFWFLFMIDSILIWGAVTGALIIAE